MGYIQHRSAPSTLANLPDILVSLASLEEEEKHIFNSLTAVLSDTVVMRDSLNRLQYLGSQFDEVESDAALLTNKISSTAQTAGRVGNRVRLLDEEMRRVKEGGDRVAQVMELKSSLADLKSSIDSQDWETATRLCARAMDLPHEVIAGPFAGSAVPTADDPQPPTQALQSLREQLRDIFLRQFQQASRARDASMTTRFFKLLPLIGWEQEGLEAYASFVLDLVQTKSPPSAKTSSPLYYVTALTALFESVCNIVDQHQPVVEKYYGQGKMQTVVRTLIRECDKVVKRLIDGWEDERSMDQKVAETSATAFSASAYSMTQKQVPQMCTDDEEVDPRGIDKVLNEAAAMTMRFSAFRRFLYVNLQVCDERISDLDADASILPSLDAHISGAPLKSGIETSACKAIFDDLLSKYYIPLEVWYLRCTINQAHKISTTDHSQVPPTTTVPDLAFYILKSVLTRLINTGSLRAVEGSIKQICEIIEHDYIGVIKRKLDDVYRNAGSTTNAGRSEKSEKENRLCFMVLLNDLDISSAHMERLVKDIISSHLLTQNFLPTEMANVQSSLSTMLNMVSKFRSTLKGGIDQLFNQLIRPRLRTLILDVYKDVSYVLDEDSYSVAEYQDLVRKRFLKTWESLTDEFKDSLTESSYRILFDLSIDVLVRPWEKHVMALKYSELGAIRFDRDIRAISTYLSSQVTFGDIREKFQRLQQISTLLNIDKDEDVDEFFSSSGIAWKLNTAEARAIARLKI
ncbi:COG4-domain-containing protein [Phellopilus nigrolimitatus]|nr:COG4-domain-containing protein [Phellopilus nigrolimitatus]